MQRHLQLLIAVLVVHIVNYVQRVDVQLREPFHHLVVLVHYVVVVEVISHNRTVLGSDLHLHHLVHAAVYSVQQALCEVRSRTEELHLLADAH